MEEIQQEKVDELRNEKQKAFDQLYDSYKNHSFYHSFHQYGNNGTNKLLNLQNSQLRSNDRKLQNISGDIDTLRQQTLLSNNEFYLRNNQIKILKSVFYFLLLTLGNIILHKLQIIPTPILYIVQLGLTVVFAIIMVNQAMWNSKRMTNNFNTFNWQISSETGSESEETKPEEVLKCRPRPTTETKLVSSEINKTKINIIV